MQLYTGCIIICYRAVMEPGKGFGTYIKSKQGESIKKSSTDWQSLTESANSCYTEWMNLEEVEQIVDDTLKNLPPEFASKLDNVGVVVQPWPTMEEFESIKAHPSSSLLFGLYRGVPKPKRPSSYSALPDKITIYAGPILMIAKDPDDARQKIRNTVLHEIGHHFGMNDEQLKIRGY